MQLLLQRLSSHTIQLTLNVALEHPEKVFSFKRL